MQETIYQFLQLKGVGEVLAKRFIEAGLDTLPRLAAATEAELNIIKGLHPAAAAAILTQARELAAANLATDSDRPLTEMLEDAERLRLGIANLVLKLRDQHAENADSKAQRNLRKEITRVLATLERVEASLSGLLLRLGKKLSKADARLSNVAEDDLDALTKGLRHTRKSIDKFVRP